MRLTGRRTTQVLLWERNYQSENRRLHGLKHKKNIQIIICQKNNNENRCSTISRWPYQSHVTNLILAHKSDFLDSKFQRKIAHLIMIKKWMHFYIVRPLKTACCSEIWKAFMTYGEPRIPIKYLPSNWVASRSKVIDLWNYSFIRLSVLI